MEVNKNGHVTLSVLGCDITWENELILLRRNGQKIHWSVETASWPDDGYDSVHRLISDQIYRVVFLPYKEVADQTDGTTKAISALAYNYGYITPKAGIIPRLLEQLNARQFGQPEGARLVALHAPIFSENEYTLVLGIISRGSTFEMIACWNSADPQWRDEDIFVFFSPDVIDD